MAANQTAVEPLPRLWNAALLARGHGEWSELLRLARALDIHPERTSEVVVQAARWRSLARAHSGVTAAALLELEAARGRFGVGDFDAAVADIHAAVGADAAALQWSEAAAARGGNADHWLALAACHARCGSVHRAEAIISTFTAADRPLPVDIRARITTIEGIIAARESRNDAALERFAAIAKMLAGDDDASLLPLRAQAATWHALTLRAAGHDAEANALIDARPELVSIAPRLERELLSAAAGGAGPACVTALAA